MTDLTTVIGEVVKIAIGVESGCWYVQLTDTHEGTSLSRAIQEGLACKEHALAIARLYEDKYQLSIVDWSK